MRSSKVIQELRLKSKPENERFISKNLDISREVYNILKDKNLTQKDFAKELGKNESEISKWLSGLHNLTLKSIAKMEAILDTDIIITPQKAKLQYEVFKYVPFVVNVNSNELDHSNGREENVLFDSKYSFNEVA